MGKGKGRGSRRSHRTGLTLSGAGAVSVTSDVAASQPPVFLGMMAQNRLQAAATTAGMFSQLLNNPTMPRNWFEVRLRNGDVRYFRFHEPGALRAEKPDGDFIPAEPAWKMLAESKSSKFYLNTNDWVVQWEEPPTKDVLQIDVPDGDGLFALLKPKYAPLASPSADELVARADMSIGTMREFWARIGISLLLAPTIIFGAIFSSFLGLTRTHRAFYGSVGGAAIIQMVFYGVLWAAIRPWDPTMFFVGTGCSLLLFVFCFVAAARAGRSLQQMARKLLESSKIARSHPDIFSVDPKNIPGVYAMLNYTWQQRRSGTNVDGISGRTMWLMYSVPFESLFNAQVLTDPGPPAMPAMIGLGMLLCAFTPHMIILGAVCLPIILFRKCGGYDKPPRVVGRSPTTMGLPGYTYGLYNAAISYAMVLQMVGTLLALVDVGFVGYPMFALGTLLLLVFMAKHRRLRPDLKVEAVLLKINKEILEMTARLDNNSADAEIEAAVLPSYDKAQKHKQIVDAIAAEMAASQPSAPSSSEKQPLLRQGGSGDRDDEKPDDYL